MTSQRESLPSTWVVDGHWVTTFRIKVVFACVRVLHSAGVDRRTGIGGWLWARCEVSFALGHGPVLSVFSRCPSRFVLEFFGVGAFTILESVGDWREVCWALYWASYVSTRKGCACVSRVCCPYRLLARFQASGFLREYTREGKRRRT